MTDAAHEVVGFVKTQPELERPDAQIGSMLVATSYNARRQVVLDRFPGMRVLGRT